MAKELKSLQKGNNPQLTIWRKQALEKANVKLITSEEEKEEHTKNTHWSDQD